MAHQTYKKSKVQRGLYAYRELYLVATERLGGDCRVEWVAVADLAEAERIQKGNKPTSYQFIHNTLSGLTQYIDQELSQ